MSITEDKIYQVLAEALENLFEIEPSRIQPQARLFEDLELDSIDAIDLIDHIKRQTGHRLQAEDFRNVRTIADVIQAVMNRAQQTENE